MKEARTCMMGDTSSQTITTNEWKAERKAQLERLHKDWINGFRHLQRYSQEHGDCLVPYTYRDPKSNFRLGKWISEQRGDKFMLPSCRERLNELDFEWDQSAIGIYKFCPKPDIQREQLIRDTSMRGNWITWIINNFTGRRSVVGSFVYPRKVHLTEIPKSVRIHAEQVICRSCQSHPDPLRRVYVAEQTSGQEIYNALVRPLPNNEESEQFLIRKRGVLVHPALSGMPDFPHFHSLMEVPKGRTPADFALLCEERWFRMNKVDIKKNPNLARVEVVRDVTAVAHYITKQYVKTQGANIILTHATLLR